MSNSPRSLQRKRGAALVEREPDIAAEVFVELAKGCERHEAAVLHTKPARPVLAPDVADVRSAAVRFHAQQVVEVDVLAISAQLVSALRGNILRLAENKLSFKINGRS